MLHSSIRQVELVDIELLRKLSIDTFIETFSAFNSEQNMDEYIDIAFATEKLEGELKDPASTFYFIYFETELAGYLKLNQGSSQTELKEKSSLEIERIYVLDKFQGKGVGQSLFEKAFEVAKINHIKYVWLGVWEENKKAIHFYEKNGFIPFDTHVFMLGDDKQTDIMMRKFIIE